LLPESIVSTLKKAIKIEQKMKKKMEIANILKTAGYIAKSSKFQLWMFYKE